MKVNIKIGPSWGSMIPYADYISRLKDHSTQRDASFSLNYDFRTPFERRRLSKKLSVTFSSDRNREYCSHDSKTPRYEEISGLKHDQPDIVRLAWKSQPNHASKLLPLFDLAEQSSSHPIAGTPSRQGIQIDMRDDPVVMAEAFRNTLKEISSPVAQSSSSELNNARFEQSQAEFF